jgi:hypothetical protein
MATKEYAVAVWRPVLQTEKKTKTKLSTAAQNFSSNWSFPKVSSSTFVFIIYVSDPSFQQLIGLSY